MGSTAFLSLRAMRSFYFTKLQLMLTSGEYYKTPTVLQIMLALVARIPFQNMQSPTIFPVYQTRWNQSKTVFCTTRAWTYLQRIPGRQMTLRKQTKWDRENRRAGSDNAADIRDVPGRAAHIPARGCTPSHADENKITGEFGHNVHET